MFLSPGMRADEFPPQLLQVPGGLSELWMSGHTKALSLHQLDVYDVWIPGRKCIPCNVPRQNNCVHKLCVTGYREENNVCIYNILSCLPG